MNERSGNHLLNLNSIIILNQNVPNPFAEKTVITFTIPEDFINAEIVFTNNRGIVVQQFKILKGGKGMVDIYADDLSNGIYNYTLVVDGKVVASKQLVCTK